MDKHERELLEIVEANKREWERLVEDNKELQADLRKLRIRYHCPYSERGVVHWLDHTDKATLEEFNREVDRLAQRYGIPEKWHADFWWYAASDYHLIEPGPSMGLPKGRFVEGEDGSIRHEIIIDADVCVHNPIVQRMIRLLQKTDLCPPQPQPVRGNPRKLDWRPVWEWYKQHPSVTYKEIAEALYYREDYIRRKLAEVERELHTKQ